MSPRGNLETGHVNAKPAGRAVVLVHGIFDSARSFGRMSRFLRERGWIPYAVDLKPASGRGGLDRLAGQLKAFIDELFAPDERVNLVGFSMGGLVARYYVQRLGGIERVRRFITLSAPHRGSLLAYLLMNKGGLQMRPGSTFITDLSREIGILERVGFASLWTPWDLSILPATSSLLPVGRQVRLPVPLHFLMIRDRRSMSAVAELLEEY